MSHENLFGRGKQMEGGHCNYNSAEGLTQGQHNWRFQNNKIEKTSGLEFLEGSLTANKIMPMCLMTIMTVQRQKNGSKDKSPPETNRAYVGSRKSIAS